MIYDAENIFIKKGDMATAGNRTSDVIANPGGGSSYDGLWLYAHTDAILSGAATITVSTSDAEAMTGAAVIATLTLPATAGASAAIKLPHGGKKFYRAVVTGATTGTLTCALVMDIDLK